MCAYAIKTGINWALGRGTDRYTLAKFKRHYDDLPDVLKRTPALEMRKIITVLEEGDAKKARKLLKKLVKQCIEMDLPDAELIDLCHVALDVL